MRSAFSLRRAPLALLALLMAGLCLAACGSGGSGQISGMGLQGRLVYSQAQDGLWQVNLETGKITQLWKLGEGAQLFGVAVAPDGQDIAVAYSPPNDATAIPRADLYLLNGDGTSPQLLMEHTGLYESFDYPTWSPDGQWLYYTRSDVFVNEDQTFGDVIINIERIPAGGGQPEVVISNAEQPSISADGSRIAYLKFDLESYTRSIWVAKIDGSDPVQLLADSRFFDVASPRFSPDGQLVAFAGSGPLQPASAVPGSSLALGPESQPAWPPAEHRGLLDWLFGAHPAYAHGLPWDFYTLPVTGGEPTKLTNWGTDGAVLSWSPFGDQMAFLHIGGLYVKSSGDPVLVTETDALHGGLDWAAEY